MKRANCIGKAPLNKRRNPQAIDPFFPEKGQSPNPGKIICFTCPVRPQCEEYKTRTGSHDGMWAGKIEKRD